MNHCTSTSYSVLGKKKYIILNLEMTHIFIQIRYKYKGVFVIIIVMIIIMLVYSYFDEYEREEMLSSIEH